MYQNYTKLRDERNLSDYAVAKNTGIPQSTFTDWKTGRSAPKMEKLIKVEEPEQGADPGYPPFGSYGDSVTIDEVLKQMKQTETEQDVSSWPTANPTYGDNCWARLPCGICSRTMMNCPLSVMQPTWTCSSSTATNQTGGEP